MNTFLVITWALICVIFLGLAIFHLVLARGKIKKLEATKLLKSGVSIAVLGQSLDKPMENLVEQLNTFVDDLNKSNRKVNRVQVLGYFLGFVTALISFVLTAASCNC